MTTLENPQQNELADLAIPDLETGLAFLSRLPLSNPLHAEACLYRLFDSLLSSPPSALTLLALLEESRVPLCFIEEELAHRYVNKPLPLANLEEQAFQKVITAWRKVTRAYALCAQLDTAEDDPDHLQRIALILHRCIYYTTMIIVEHHRARRELPPGVWLDLHGFYASAEEWNVVTLPLTDTLDPLQRTTDCASAYVSALLIDSAGPYSNSVQDQNLVRRWAKQWSSNVEIVRVKTGEPMPPFVIDLMQDAGLKPFSECLSIDGIRRLDVSRLSVTLAHVSHQLAQRMSPSQIGLGEDCTSGQCSRLLELVRRPWGNARAIRKFKRHARAGSARVGAGFEKMHFLVSGHEFTQPESARIYSRGEFDSLFSFRELADPVATLTIKQNTELSRPEEWSIVNQSANGFRLARSLAGQSVAHGQLLAVCPNDGARFVLAKVTWLMQARSGGLVAGISILPGIPLAIAVRAAPLASGHQELYERGFLLESIEPTSVDSSLVLPQGWYLAGKSLEIYSDKLTRVYLKHVLEDGSDFARISYALDE